MNAKTIWLIVFFALGVFVAITLGNGLWTIHEDLDRSNKIECVKLRESADALGPIDREACPWEMGG